MLSLGRTIILLAAAGLYPTSVASEQIADFAKAQAADPLAQYVKASGWVETGKDPVFVELLIDGQNAAIRRRTAINQTPEVQVLSLPSQALTLLADKRMQFLWAPLTDWAGPSLEKMRDRTLAQLRNAANAGNPEFAASSTSESTARPKVRAVIQLAQFLIDNGQAGEAERVLQDQLATMKVKTNESLNAIEWFSIAAWIASARWERGDSEGAIAQYAMIERTLGKSAYADNATISKAAMLVESGRYEEGLAAIDPLWHLWMRDNRGYKVIGSDRQFAWIRACALAGLGRSAEAEAAFQPVSQASDTRDPHFVIEVDDILKLRGRVCMKQVDAVIRIIADQLKNKLSPDALLLLQPAYRPPRDAEFWEKVRSDPGLAKLTSERMRILPVEMTPALNHWRQLTSQMGHH